MQGGVGYNKDGFLQVLTRHRSQNASRLPVAWKDEGIKDVVYIVLREVHDQARAKRGTTTHAAVPYRARRDKHLVGPGEARKSLQERTKSC
jgi:hypothetical protein